MKRRGLPKLIIVISLVVALAIVVPLMSGCIGKPAAEKEQPEVWKYGTIQAMTGFGSYWGEVQAKAHILAAEQLTLSGEFPFAIEVIVGDHRSDDPTAALNAAHRLIDIEHVPWINSSWVASTMAINPLCQENKVVEINAVGTGEGLVGLPWLHNLRLQANQINPAIMDYMYDTYNFSKAAIFWWNDAGPTAQSEIAKQWCAQNGVDIVFAEPFEPNTTEFRTVLTEIEAKDPDVIFIWGYGADVGYFVKQAREKGMYPAIPIATNYVDDVTYQGSGEALDGVVWGDAFWWPALDSEMSREFKSLYSRKWGVPEDEINQCAAMEWEAAMGVMRKTLHHVIDNGGDPFDGEQLEMAIREIKFFPTIFSDGEMELLPNGMNIKPMFIVRQGKTLLDFEVLTTVERAEPLE
ncbi:MAG: amino acid ABC transporter substrate-binding protein [Dehalococcoidia bacterium]|nr:MAG: amino acid ABC transporter substrate-binding protein [Dehalococcoidia bacterium]